MLNVSVLPKFSKMSIYSFCNQKKSEKEKMGCFFLRSFLGCKLPSLEPPSPSSGDRGGRKTRMGTTKNRSVALFNFPPQSW